MRKFVFAVALLFIATPTYAAMTIGPLSSNSTQGGGGGTAPVVTLLSPTPNVASPLTNGTTVTRTLAGGPVSYSATCGGVACTGANAITSWAISSQSCASCYAITSAGLIQGSTNAANVGTETDTITVTATNSTGTSPGVTQTVNAYADGSVGATVCSNTQYPSLLSAYTAPPPWNSPGVNYYVGIASNATVSGNTITETGTQSTPTNGDKKTFYNFCNNSLPSGITQGTAYFVVAASGSTYQISTTLGGSAITLGASSAFVALKDPGHTTTLATGTNNGGSEILNITGNNVTIDHYDFSLEGGWFLLPHSGGVSGLTVTNNFFKISTNQNNPFWNQGNAVTNLTFNNNYLNYNAVPFFINSTGVASGNTVLPMSNTTGVFTGMVITDFTTTGAIATPVNSGGAITRVSAVNPGVSVTLSTATIATVNSNDSISFQWETASQVPGWSQVLGGTATVQYNWFQNAASEHMQMSPLSTGGTVTMQYNLYDQSGWAGLLIGQHGDIIQIFNTTGSIATVNMTFNTVWQTNALIGALGLQFCSGTAGMTIGTINETNNVWAEQDSSTNSLGTACFNSGNVTTAANLKNNYIDETGMLSGWYCIGAGCGGASGGNSPTITISGNKCMTNGATPNSNGSLGSC